MKLLAVVILVTASLPLMATEVFHSPHEERYKYALEQSNEDPVCKHMTGVFNARFEKPWDRGHADSHPDATVFGIPYDKMFERMPGVAHDSHYTFDMMLSKFPMSKEFEALTWREGRLTHSDISFVSPILVTRWTPPNGSGEPLWIFKSTFIRRMTTHQGWEQNDGGFDTLDFIRTPDFQLTTPIDSRIFHHQAWQVGVSVSLGRETARQLRPFVFRDHLYIAAYQPVWPDDLPASFKETRLYPDEEFMNILRLLPGSIPGKYVDIARTEVVCRIRMLMKPPTTSKGVK